MTWKAPDKGKRTRSAHWNAKAITLDDTKKQAEALHQIRRRTGLSFWDIWNSDKVEIQTTRACVVKNVCNYSERNWSDWYSCGGFYCVWCIN
jgi:hypothetical protein